MVIRNDDSLTPARPLNMLAPAAARMSYTLSCLLNPESWGSSSRKQGSMVWNSSLQAAFQPGKQASVRNP